jgi:hypothetical protein
MRQKENYVGPYIGGPEFPPLLECRGEKEKKIDVVLVCYCIAHCNEPYASDYSGSSTKTN